MPQLAAVEIFARDARKGDVLETRVIETKKVGSKWTELRDVNGGLVRRIENMDKISVRRMQPTPEEKATAREAYRIETLNRTHADMLSAYKDATDKITQCIARGQILSANMMGDAIHADEMRRMGEFITSCLEEGMSLQSGFKALKHKIERALIDGYNDPTYSGGFSFNNAERQMRITAMRQLLQSFPFMAIED